MTQLPVSPHDALRQHPRPTSRTVRGTGPAVILVGYDRGEDGSSANALSYAAGMAARSGARLVVLAVDVSLELACPPRQQDCWHQVVGEVRRIVGDCADACDVAVGTGDAAAVIARVADEVQADVIVVGRCTHPWLHPLGSVPGRLVRRARQPVLVVP